MSIRMEHLGFHSTNFHETWYLTIFQNCVEKIQVSLKSDKDNLYFTCRQYATQLLLEWGISDESSGEYQKTHFISSIFYPKIIPFTR
jgi:hypothetical protein